MSRFVSGVRNSAPALCKGLGCPSGYITTDKSLRYASPKLPSATSFISKPFNEMPASRLIYK